MADPTFDWGLFLEAQRMKNQNKQQGYQNLAAAGQGLGQGLASIGQLVGDQKKKALLRQILQAQKSQQTPIQGPQGYMPPGAGPNATPAGQTPDMSGTINSLLTQYDPQGMTQKMEGQVYPSTQDQYLRWKMTQGAKPPLEWSPVSGMTDKQGNPIEIDKTTGEMKVVPIPGGTKSTGYGQTMGPIRQAQYTIQDLPSNQGPNTAGGAAYQVKVGAKQGKALIARPGSPQRTAAAAADLVRSITRVAPTDMALGTTNFSQNLVQRWSTLKQTLTADPSQVDNPKIRKEMYDIFDEMDKSATPFIANQLDDMADAGFPVSANTRKRQLGETLPNIPYQEGSGQSPQVNGNAPSTIGRFQVQVSQ